MFLLLLLLLLVVIHIESSRVKQEILSNCSPYDQFNYNLSIEFIFKLCMIISKVTFILVVMDCN